MDMINNLYLNNLDKCILDKDLNSALYGQVSGVVLVARAGVTRRPLLRDYIDEIKSEGGTVLGVILSTDKRK